MTKEFVRKAENWEQVRKLRLAGDDTMFTQMMRRVLVGFAAVLSMALLPGVGNAKPKTQQRPMKLVMSPASTVPSSDVVKNLMYKCPNVTLTLDSTKSDYMLEARGWQGHWKFTLFKPGGDAVFSTSTVMLSNAVKDVCKYVNTYAGK